MSVWKRNAVVVAIVLFVGAAVYLNWSYSKEAADGGKDGEGGKLLGQTTLVNGENDGKGGTGKNDGKSQRGPPRGAGGRGVHGLLRLGAAEPPAGPGQRTGAAPEGRRG